MAADSIEVSEAPRIAKPPQFDNAAISAQTARKPGEGAGNFQRIADASHGMVKTGQLSSLTLTDSGQGTSHAPEQKGAETLRGTAIAGGEKSDVRSTAPAGDAQTESAAREYSRRAAAETAAKIASGGDPQKVLSEGMQKFIKNNPNADPTTFARALESAFRHDPKTSSLTSWFTNNAVIIRDRNAVTATNPGGVAAAVSNLPTDTADGQRAQASLDTARKLLAAGDKGGRSTDTYDDSVMNMTMSGELTGVPDLPPRTRSPNAPSLEQQAADLSQRWHRSVPNSAVTSALNLADNLAFNTSGANLSAGFSQAVDSLVQQGVDSNIAARLLTSGLNTVTQSNDFGLNIRSSGDAEMGTLRDKRLASSANPAGSTDSFFVASVGTNANDVASDFKDAQQTVSILKQGRLRLGPNATKQDVQQFVNDAISDYHTLGFQSF
jgi:hypothetical protein